MGANKGTPLDDMILVVRSGHGQEFIHQEISRLRTQLSHLGDLTDLCVEASIHASLATFYHMANDLLSSSAHIQAALKLKQDGESDYQHK